MVPTRPLPQRRAPCSDYMHVGRSGPDAAVSLASHQATDDPAEEGELPECPAGGQWATDSDGNAVLLALDEIPDFLVPGPMAVAAQAARLASGAAFPGRAREHAGGPSLAGPEHEALAAREGTRMLEALSWAAANRERCPSHQALARLAAVRPWVKPALDTYPEVARRGAAARVRRALGLMLATEEQEAAPASMVRSAAAMEAAVRIRSGGEPASGEDASGEDVAQR